MFLTEVWNFILIWIWVPDWGLASWYWFGYSHWSLVHPYAKFWLSILILKVQRTSMSFKSSFGALGNAEGSWVVVRIFIFARIWLLVFDSPMFQILALYLDFEGAKNIHVLQVLIWALGDTGGFQLGFHILIIIKLQNSSQKVPASSKASNHDLKDIYLKWVSYHIWNISIQEIFWDSPGKYILSYISMFSLLEELSLLIMNG